MLDTSRIMNEKNRRFFETLGKRVNELEELVVSQDARIAQLEEQIASVSSPVSGKGADIRKGTDASATDLYLDGYEDTKDTVENLREQLDLLGVKYHSAHKERKLRELLNEALSSEKEKEALNAS